MRHWIQNVAARWKTTSLKEKPALDYNPNYDKTREYLKDIYKKENKWKQDLRKRLNSKVPTYNSNWTNVAASTITAVTPAQNSILNINGNTNKVEVTTSLDVKASLIVDGRDVMKELDEMRDALLLLKRDVDMEAKYPRLKELKDEYERTLEKYKTFDAIKESK